MGSLIPLFNEGGSLNFLPPKLGGPRIILQKCEGGSHKINLPKNEFHPPHPLYFMTSP